MTQQNEVTFVPISRQNIRIGHYKEIKPSLRLFVLDKDKSKTWKKNKNKEKNKITYRQNKKCSEYIETVVE